MNDELKKFLEAPFKFDKPLTVEEDENGVIHFKNSNGFTVLMMCREDYEAFLTYKEKKI